MNIQACSTEYTGIVPSMFNPFKQVTQSFIMTFGITPLVLSGS
jgi:hypothetical protein